MSRVAMSILVLLALLAGGLAYSRSVSFADDTVLTMPGMKMQSHRGWFGSHHTTYTDSLGNEVTDHQGWFGRARSSGKLFGTRLSQDGDQVEVTAPNGTKLVEHHSGWFGFGPRTTEIHGDRIWDAFKSIGSPSKPSTNNP